MSDTERRFGRVRGSGSTGDVGNPCCCTVRGRLGGRCPDSVSWRPPLRSDVEEPLIVSGRSTKTSCLTASGLLRDRAGATLERQVGPGADL